MASEMVCLFLTHILTALLQQCVVNADASVNPRFQRPEGLEQESEVARLRAKLKHVEANTTQEIHLAESEAQEAHAAQKAEEAKAAQQVREADSEAERARAAQQAAQTKAAQAESAKKSAEVKAEHKVHRAQVEEKVEQVAAQAIGHTSVVEAETVQQAQNNAAKAQAAIPKFLTKFLLIDVIVLVFGLAWMRRTAHGRAFTERMSAKISGASSHGRAFTDRISEKLSGVVGRRYQKKRNAFAEQCNTISAKIQSKGISIPI